MMRSVRSALAILLVGLPGAAGAGEQKIDFEEAIALPNVVGRQYCTGGGGYYAVTAHRVCH